jgi:WD40 repeat protein
MQERPLIENRCPYPGLRPFRTDEADLFFGRDEQVDDLLDRLGRSQFLAVVGESGCGKSSLIYAGMIPALETGFLDSAGADWLFATMRPGSQPMRNLATALLASGAIASGPDHPAEDSALIEAELRRGPLGLLDALREGGGARQANLLLVVDQFEEIFRFRNQEGVVTPADEHSVDRNEAAAFVALLLRTIREPDARVFVVLTMRSDFLGDCALFTGLPEALNDSQFLTPRLSFDQRKSAIEGPARVEGGRVEPDVTTALLNDMGPGPDQLPLMQHALMRAWNAAHLRAAEAPPSVELRDYVGIGRLKDALSLHADSAFENLREDQKPIAQRLFRALTGGTSLKRDTRRPTRLGEVAAIAGTSPEAVAQVVDHFRGGHLNFLTPAEGPLGPETILDISHESLIRQWTRLDRWAKDEAKSAETYRLLERTAAEQIQPWVGSDLEAILRWRDREHPSAVWAARHGGDFAAAMSFIEAGQARQKQNEEDRRATLRREQQVRIIKALAALAAVVVAVTASLAFWALRERTRAVKSEAFAEAKRYEALESKKIADAEARKASESAAAARASEAEANEQRRQAEKQTERTNALILASKAQNLSERFPTLSVLLASQAIQTNLSERAPLNVEAENVLRRALGTISGTSLPVPEDTASCGVYSPDGKTIAAGFGSAARGGVILWDAVRRQRLRPDPLTVKEGPVTSLAFSPDGKTLAAGYARLEGADPPGGGVVLWDAIQWQRLRAEPLAVKEGAVTSVAISAQDNIIAAGYFNMADNFEVIGGLELWDPRDGRRRAIVPLAVKNAAIYDAAFSPDGKTLAAAFGGSGGVGGGVLLADTAGRVAHNSLAVNEGSFTSVAFSPDGQSIAAGYVGERGVDGGVKLWDTISRVEAERLAVKEGRVGGVAFSHDGKTIAAAYEVLSNAGGTGVVRWDTMSKQRLAADVLVVREGKVSGVAFSPDGKTIAMVDEAGLRVWDATDRNSAGVEPRVLNEPPAFPSSFGASPDGTWIIEARGDLARAWKLPIPDSASAEPIDLALDGVRFPSLRSIPAPDILFDAEGRRFAIVGHRDIAVWDCATAITSKPRTVLHAPGDSNFHGTVLSRGGRWLSTRTGSSGVIERARRTRVHLFDLDPVSKEPVGTEYSRILEPPTKPESIAPDSKSGIITKRPETAPNRVKQTYSAIQQSPPPFSQSSPYPGRDAFPPDSDSPPPTSATAFSGDGRWMATCNRGAQSILWDLKASNPAESTRVVPVTGKVSAVAFDPTSRVFVAASVDLNETNVLKLQSWRIGGDLAEPAPDSKHEKRIDIASKGPSDGDVWLAFSPNGGRYLSIRTSTGCVLFEWMETGFGSSSAFPVGPNPLRLPQIFSANSQWLLPSQYSPDISLISLSGTKPSLAQGLSLSTGSSSRGIWADFSPDSHELVTAGSDASVHLLDLDDYFRPRGPAESPPPARIFPGLSAPVSPIRFSPGSTQLATVAGDGIIRIWRLDTAKLLETAQRVVGRNLTGAEWKQYFPGVRYHKTFPDLAEPPREATR